MFFNPCPINFTFVHLVLHIKLFTLIICRLIFLFLKVDVKDSEGRVFDGVDSVDVSWSLSDSSLGQLEAATGLLRKKQLDLLQQPSKPYQMLKVNKKIGSLDIKASLPKPGLLSSPPESTVKLALVEDARIEPKSMEVFHHKSAHTAGKAVQGSGYFILETLPKGKVLNLF